jgi:outer membrane protein
VGVTELTIGMINTRAPARNLTLLHKKSIFDNKRILFFYFLFIVGYARKVIMNRFIPRYLLMSIACASALFEAGAAPATKRAVAPKVAYVKVQRLITIDNAHIEQTVDEWQTLYNALQKKLEPVDKELAELNEKFEKGRNEFEALRSGGLAKKEALQNKYEEVARLQYELERKAQERENFISDELAKAQSQVVPKIKDAIKSIATSEGWDAVMPSDTMLYVDDQFDITDKVKTEVNKRHQATLKTQEKAPVQNVQAQKPESKKS